MVPDGKKNGAVNQSEQDDLRVEALSGLDDQESAELIAQHFASISQEYLPLNRADLPAFLPALPPPRVDELEEELNALTLKLKKLRHVSTVELVLKKGAKGGQKSWPTYIWKIIIEQVVNNTPPSCI